MLIDRLKEFIDYKGLNIFAFEKSIGMSNNTIRKKLVNSRSTMGSDTIQAILNSYPELSPDWLLLGVGEMLRSENKEVEAKASKEDEVITIIKQQQQTISELSKALTTLIENSTRK